MIEFRIKYTTDEETGSDYNGYPEYRTTSDELSAPTLSDLYELIANVQIDNDRYSGHDVTFEDTIEEVQLIAEYRFNNDLLLNTESYKKHNENVQRLKEQDDERKRITQYIIDTQTETKERIMYENLKQKFEPLSALIDQTIKDITERMEPLGSDFQKVLDDNYEELLTGNKKE